MRHRLKPLKWFALALCLALLTPVAATRSRCVAWIGKPGAFGFGYGVAWVKIRWVTPPARLGWWIGEIDVPNQGWSFKHQSGAVTGMFGLRRVTPYTYEVRLVYILAPLAPLTALLFYRDIRRIPPYRCQVCRYDLRGTPRRADGTARCPECGTPRHAHSCAGGEPITSPPPPGPAP